MMIRSHHLVLKVRGSNGDTDGVPLTSPIANRVRDHRLPALFAALLAACAEGGTDNSDGSVLLEGQPPAAEDLAAPIDMESDVDVRLDVGSAGTSDEAVPPIVCDGGATRDSVKLSIAELPTKRTTVGGVSGFNAVGQNLTDRPLDLSVTVVASNGVDRKQTTLKPVTLPANSQVVIPVQLGALRVDDQKVLTSSFAYVRLEVMGAAPEGYTSIAYSDPVYFHRRSDGKYDAYDTEAMQQDHGAGDWSGIVAEERRRASAEGINVVSIVVGRD